MKTILLVDDDPAILRLIASALQKNGYQCILSSSGEEALTIVERRSVDAIVLDVVLPIMDGIEALKHLRAHPLHRHIPVVILTQKGSEVDTVLGLEMGADDYLSKPVRYHELLARLKSILKRKESILQGTASLLDIHGIKINLLTRSVEINEKYLALTYKEFELLALLANHPGTVFTRNHLLSSLWHDEQFVETRTVDVHIRRLRKKLEDSGIRPEIIETVRNIGYRIVKPDSSHQMA